jgi:two-component system sensor histidine kinase GlrK
MEGARISLRLLQALDGVLEFASKYQILADPGYLTQWLDWEAAVEEDLRQLAGVDLTPTEEEYRLSVGAKWAEYRSIVTPVEAQGRSMPPEVLLQVQGVLTETRQDVDDLIATTNAAIAEQSATSAEAASRARTVAWISAGLAVFVAAVSSLLLYLSISGPLRRLTRGTREIARGRFDHRLRIQGPRELSSLARDFDRMAARLDELENLKRDFVSHVSHELKTPLAAIQETIEVLLDELPGPLTPKQTRLLELSRSSSGRLSSMISDLLETSRLESGAAGYMPSWNDVADLTRSVLDEVEPLAVERRLEVFLRVESPAPEIVCDRNRVRDVVMNLVTNAVKFSAEGRRVRIIIRDVTEVPDECPPTRYLVRREPGPFLLLSVEDEGPGVPDRDKEGIFEKFHQVRRGERLRGQGVGLGLAIAWRIVEAHAGALWVEDREPLGSVFQMLLPKVPSQWGREIARRPSAMPAKVDPSERMTIPVGGGLEKVAMGAVAAVVLAGCASPAPAPATAPPPIPELVEVILPAPVVEPPLELPSSAALRLVSGWDAMSSGAYEEAYGDFQAVMAEEGTPDVTGEAVWGMALLHLFPESPYFDPEWAGTLLDYLIQRFPNDGLGIQAAWVQAMLGDLADVRTMVAEQEAALQRLEETVDQLRAIDLNRAPSGTAPQRPGTAAPTPLQNR